MAKKNLINQSRKKKAWTLFQSNRLAEAKELYTRIGQSDKRDVDIWLTLGVINRQLGLFDEAKACCRHALTIQPENAAAHHALGAALQCQGKMEDALSCYRTAIRLKPDFTDAYYFLGNALREYGEFPEAVTCYRKAVQLRPDFLEALCNLGATLRHLGKFHESLEFLESALRIRPDTVQVHCNLAEVLLYLNKSREALQHAETAIRINPGFFDAQRAVGNIHRQLGNYDEALKYYRAALNINPGDADVAAAIANILEIRGEFDDSLAFLQPFLTAENFHPGIVTVFSRLSTQFGTQEQASILMEQALLQDNLSGSDSINIHYELGKLLEEMKHYDRAFEHYRQANEEDRGLNSEIVSKYDPYQLANDTATWMKECDVDFWAQLPHVSHDIERPVFVVGMPRSGTSLAEQILASHPSVFGAGELTGIHEIVNSLYTIPGADVGYPQCLATVASKKLDALAKRYLERLSDISPDALRVVDKMPTNFMHLGLISLLFPKAHIIHMVRDPLDTCLSIYFQKFGATLPYTTDLTHVGVYYRAYKNLMDYWKENLDISILEIQYEELVSEVEKTSKDMVEFCGLDWDARCLSFHKTKRDVNTPSYGQVRQPIYTKSVGRWKHYEPYLDPLKKALEL